MAEPEPPDPPTEPSREEQEAYDYFDSLAGRISVSGPLEVEAAQAPRRIGPYRTLRLLGRGGMGSVYLAERADGQFDQQVALKLIRIGLETPEAIARFGAERQILARLQHAGIARLLDGGVSEEGRPYFVMERVAGTPITGFCDAKRLGVEERLRLFLSVCDAVQYAHRNLVVHRDLKPANVLVTEDGSVKLLDFGIAKVLSDDASPTGGLTATGARPMTPVYAAPEQFRGDAITTATDVYALGVILYELLAGRVPISPHGRSDTEMERAVLEEQPERPSLAGVSDASVATARGTTPARLRRRLGGDADTIVLMALRKEPERRYRSVDQMADDVRRHLNGLPVLAHKDTLGYRAAKFVRRHRVGVAATAALFALLVAFAAAMAAQSARVARERDKAQRVAALFVDLFKVSDPAEARGGAITARELLDRGASAVEKGLDDQPETQAALKAVLGRVYQSLGLYDKAAPFLEGALETRRRVLGPESDDVGESLNDLGELLRQKGDFKAALPVLREALALNRRLDAEGPRTALSLNHLGKVLYATGALDEADALLREGLAINRKRLGDAHPDVAESLNNLAAISYAKGDDRAATALFLEALGIRRTALGPDHPMVAASLNNLASVQSRMGDFAAAEQTGREAVDIYRKLYGEHPRVATALNNLGLTHFARGDFAAAEPLYRESLAMRRKLLPATHPEIAQVASNLGLLLQRSQRLPEAEGLHREALAIRQKALGPKHPLVAISLNNLGELAQLRGQRPEAEKLYREGLDLIEKQHGHEHALVAISLDNLGSLALENGDLARAEALYRDSLGVRRKVLRPGHPEIAHSLMGLGRTLARAGQTADAEASLREALELREKALPKDAPEVADARQALAALGAVR